MNARLDELPPHLRFVFAPLIKRAMGFAVGCAAGSILVFLTVFQWSRTGVSDQYLWLLANYFPGYDPGTWHGPLVGFFWVFWCGFVMGWFFAMMRNLLVAIWTFSIRAKAQLEANRDFLDHI